MRSSDGASGTVTRLELPLKERAEPNLPAVHVVPLAVPLFDLPEASPTVVPVLSSNPYAATRPVGGGGAAAFANVAVYVTSDPGSTTVCERWPPSDQPVKTQLWPFASTWSGAFSASCQASQPTRVDGAVCPNSSSRSPAGLVASVTFVFEGRMFIEVVRDSPLESVAVSCTSR